MGFDYLFRELYLTGCGGGGLLAWTRLRLQIRGSQEVMRSVQEETIWGLVSVCQVVGTPG